MADAPLQEFLPRLARANYLAKLTMGGRIEPLFSLHAARLQGLKKVSSTTVLSRSSLQWLQAKMTHITKDLTI